MCNLAVDWVLHYAQVQHSSAKFVLVVMAQSAQAPGYSVMLSVDYLAQATGQDRKTVMANLRRLKDAGLIALTGRRWGETGQMHVYQIMHSEQFGTGDGQTTEQANSTVFPDKSTSFGLNSTNIGQSSTKNGTVKEYQKRDSLPPERVPILDETVPKTDLKSTNFGLKSTKNGTSYIISIHKDSNNNINNTYITEIAEKEIIDVSANYQPSGPISLAVEFSIELRKWGVRCDSANPKLHELAKQGISLETLRSACEEADSTKGKGNFNVGYVVGILRNWAEQSSSMKVRGARKPELGQQRGYGGFDATAHINRNRVH